MFRAVIAIVVILAPIISNSQNLIKPEEKHFKNMRQLTFGGENAEAYFSGDDSKLIFQSTRDGRQCDQIYSMNVDGSDVRQLTDNNYKDHAPAWSFLP